jgi:subtilisin-like proprotein convertase family protein
VAAELEHPTLEDFAQDLIVNLASPSHRLSIEMVLTESIVSGLSSTSMANSTGEGSSLAMRTILPVAAELEHPTLEDFAQDLIVNLASPSHRLRLVSDMHRDGPHGVHCQWTLFDFNGQLHGRGVIFGNAND